MKVFFLFFLVVEEEMNENPHFSQGRRGGRGVKRGQAPLLELPNYNLLSVNNIHSFDRLANTTTAEVVYFLAC